MNRHLHATPKHLAATAGLALCCALGAACAAAADERTAKHDKFRDVLASESRHPELCHARPGRAYVTHRFGASCMAYFVTAGHETNKRAIVFLDGDISGERYQQRADNPEGNAAIRKKAQRLADRFKVRVVVISRMGIDGSSGNHGRRRQPIELMAVTETVDVVKKRLGVDQVVLAGQSGGSTLAASLLTLGRKDIACAVLGSGAFALNDMLAQSAIAKGRRFDPKRTADTVYDPTRNLATIHPDPKRRIFVLGDPDDQRTPFAQQKAFAEALAANGHTVEWHVVRAGSPLRHGATDYTLPVAALCANDAPNERIRRGISKHRDREIARATRSKATVLSVAD